MSRGKKFTAEQIIGKLREAEVELARGKTQRRDRRRRSPAPESLRKGRLRLGRLPPCGDVRHGRRSARRPARTRPRRDPDGRESPRHDGRGVRGRDRPTTSGHPDSYGHGLSRPGDHVSGPAPMARRSVRLERRAGLYTRDEPVTVEPRCIAHPHAAVSHPSWGWRGYHHLDYRPWRWLVLSDFC